MFLKTVDINNKSLVADIVARDYRTADVFRQHGISYCCGGKWPIEVACDMRGVDKEKLQAELEAATRTIQVSNKLNFSDWDIDFLVNYLINVHHQYLKKSLPETQQLLSEFAQKHIKKFPYLEELEKQFGLLIHQLESSIEREEEVLFPYIRQIAHAHMHQESYGALMIRKLRKPVEETMFKGHETLTNIILSIRELTNKYTTPENVCISHKVVIAKLRELDNDLIQHLDLERSVLFPRSTAIEKELLNA